MSIAGIQSNRGDIYQTLVGFDWALTVLSDQEYEWLEIDSVKYTVDDVVISRCDGYLIACQCKKNKTGFSPWTVHDLGDELAKASSFLKNNSNSEVRFYSRNNYGHLGNLKEHSSTQSSEASFLATLGVKQQATNAKLQRRLTASKSGLSTYEFLKRTKYITSDEMDRMVQLLLERLGNLVSNPSTAFEALWTHLDLLGARIGGDGTSSSIKHRLTKNDLKEILSKNGSVEFPRVDINEVRNSFTSTSAIGRAWKRDIAGHQISNQTLDQLIVGIELKKRSILLTGKPGSGKTCVLLTLQEHLESEAQLNKAIVPLFIQTREFADLDTSSERHSHGLTAQWVEKAARLAEEYQVVIVLDSLDVLSIAREHSVLTYFLAQIDRLLLIPNITVVTACRDFDRHYDRRIAQRTWDLEVKCQALNWEIEISPLLHKFGIPTDSIDLVTRELISNPRELEMFVELAKLEGSFNVVTSQALAQRYLDVIVRSNDSLGVEGLDTIENIANEMLKTRSLTITRQRITAKQEIVHELCSLNVIQETKDKKLTFGHQTLLDVLVISSAVRKGVTLSEFINSLPPVPFVRPSIRSFVAELALGERREFRKQLRAVLTGDFAFHIRRLVAESFAEQLPDDSDWSLIRDLRNNQRAVFQVIYGDALATEWHYFWLKNLVPELLTHQDVDGLSTHVHRVAQWRNDDPEGVIQFWIQALSLSWLPQGNIASRIEISLSEVDPEGAKFAPRLLNLLFEIPNEEHRFLGRAIANCLAAGLLEDALLWSYVTENITPEVMLDYRLEDKLNCQPHKFGNKNENFILQRMQESETLLDLAIDSIELWSKVHHSRFLETRIGYRVGFLRESSYANIHSKSDFRHVDNLTILLNAVEKSIVNHAKNNSEWWKINRNRLCFNIEGSLLYFAIEGCTGNPEANLEIIGRMLCDKNMLESKLYFELGNLTKSAFPHLDQSTQDKIMAVFQVVWKLEDTDEEGESDSLRLGVLRNRADLFLAIPRCFRSTEGQAIIDACEKRIGAFTREPDIDSWEGWVSPPFTFEVFHNISDLSVIRLLLHFNGIYEINEFGSLLGGSRSVGIQLQDAASRQPARFMSLLKANWVTLPEEFREDIMDGLANYLSYRYGNLQSNSPWEPFEETEAIPLAHQIIDELECHPLFWSNRRAASKALEACSNVIESTQIADRIIFLIIGYINRIEPDPKSKDKVDLISRGINMAKGDVTEALMLLACKFQHSNNYFPRLLEPTLRRYAKDENPAIRALILRRLPYMQNKNFDLGWSVFDTVMQFPEGLWELAESCFYYGYYNNFEKVQPWLKRLWSEGQGEGLETLGRISALAAMRNHISFSELLQQLIKLESKEAWHGASGVWTHPENYRQHRSQCLEGLEIGLSIGGEVSLAIATQMDHMYRDKSSVISVPVKLIKLCFDIFERDSEKKHNDLYGFSEWLNVTSQRDPNYALEVIEIYLNFVSKTKPYIYDIGESFPQLMTRLFAEAEELEDSDYGAMLQRVVVIQDKLLSTGVNGVEDWLKAAEKR